MLINNVDFFLEVLFELTLFFLLVVFLYKISKQYIIPMLYQEIDKIRKKEKETTEKKQLLVASKKKLELQIEEQGVELVVLEKKVKRWQEFILQSNQQKSKCASLYLERIENKREKQKENLSLLKVQEVVIPRSIELAYKEIEQKYSNKKGWELLKELIITIEPNNKKRSLLG